MICPNCGGEQHCPCKTCKPRSAGKVVWSWIMGEDIMCGHCGYVNSADWWFDDSMRQYEAQKAQEVNQEATARSTT